MGYLSRSLMQFTIPDDNVFRDEYPTMSVQDGKVILFLSFYSAIINKSNIISIVSDIVFVIRSNDLTCEPV